MGRFSRVRQLVAGAAVAGLLAAGVVSAGAVPAEATTVPAGAMVLTLHTSADSTEVDLPLSGTVTDITVDWGDGSTVDSGPFNAAGAVPHTYAHAGTYVVAISGTALTHFGKTSYPYAYAGSDTITTVSSWGALGITSLRGAFAGATRLTTVPPYLPAEVTDLTAAFFGATAFNAAIGGWDTSHATDLTAMFYNASAFNQPIGTWDTSSATSLVSMFVGASAFNQPISLWDTSAVTSMSNMFSGAAAFNQDISGWNTTKVTSTYAMFSNAGSFNQPIGTWNTSAVTTMGSMFASAGAFNQSLAAWDTGAVTDMSQMFVGAGSFNQSLGGWNIGQLTGASLMLTSSGLSQDNYDSTLIGWARQSHQGGVTLGATGRTYSADGAPSRAALVGDTWSITDEGQGANAPLTLTVTTTGAGGVDLLLVKPVDVTIDWGDGSTDTGIDTSTLAYHLYAAAGSHTVSISGARLAGLGDSSTAHAPSATGPVNITAVTSWGTLGITRLSGALSGATSLTSVPAALPPNATDLSHMFDGATSFDQALGEWDISQVTDMTDMLNGTASALKAPADVATAQDNYDTTLIGWARQPHRSTVTLGASGRTYSADGAPSRTALTGDSWTITDGGQGTNRPMQLTYTTTRASQTITLPLGGYNNCSSNASGGTATDLTIDWGDSTATTPFSSPRSNVCPTHTYTAAGTYHVSISGTLLTDFGSLQIAVNSALVSADSWGTLGLTSLVGAFRSATGLTAVPAHLPANVTNVASMLSATGAFNQDISGWDISRVTNLASMFRSSRFNGDISRWDTSSVTNMSSMFVGAGFNQDISRWDTSRVTNMSSMFSRAGSFNRPLNGWDTSSVTNMESMFSDAAEFNQDISRWDTSHVGNMSFMFERASGFNQSLASWRIAASTNLTGALDGSGMTTATYDATLRGWAAQSPPVGAGVTLTGGPAYTGMASEAHDYLSGTLSWSITDGGATPAVTVIAESMMVSSGDPLPAIGYTTSPAVDTLGYWVWEPTCGVYSLDDTRFTSALSGVKPAGMYATHCAGGAGDAFTPGAYVDGVLTVSQSVPTVTISNMPASAVVGDTFTPTFTTGSDGTALAAGTPGVCTVNGGTGLVSFVGLGTCALTASVTPTPAWAAADGSAQQVSVAGLASVTVVTCPASVVFTGAARTPCSVSVTGAGGLSLAPAPVYSANTAVGTASATYTYAGDATHAGSSDTTTFLITAAAPSVARSVTGSPRNRSVVVSWLSPTSTGGASITGYQVTASPKVGSVYKSCSWIRTTPAKPLACAVPGLANGRAYTFTVKATNSGGKSSTTPKSAAVVAGAPTQARTLAVTFPAAKTAKATWAAAQFIGSGAITGYRVRWCKVSGSCAAWASLPKTARSATATARVKNTNYRVEIQAKNGSGYGPTASKVFKQAK